MELRFNLDLLAAAPAITALDLSALRLSDSVNLILQRSEVLYDDDRTEPAIKAWFGGDGAPLADLAEEHRERIARRAAAVILMEFNLMRPELDAIAPKRIADIGCGYAFFSLFAAQAYGAHALLIDLESNDARHFGYQEVGAAYSSLSVARKLLTDNGVSTRKITILNPNETDPLDAKPVDLAVSFLSAGFHYPISTYTPFFEQKLAKGGHAIFDLRRRTAREQLEDVTPLGAVRDLSPPPKARRILLTRGGA